MDFLINEKKEGSIKETYIDGNLSSKMILKDGTWIDVCIKAECIKLPEKNSLCKRHVKEQAFILENTIVKKKDKMYSWSGGKWASKCNYISCGKHAIKLDYCNEHSTYRTSENGSNLIVGNTYDIFNAVSSMEF